MALVLREVYLDFYSKSLKEQGTKPETLTYSKKLQAEQQEHKEILDKIIMGANPASFKSKYEFDNGDPDINPRLKKEEELTVKQHKLAGTYKEKAAPEDKYKVSADGFFVEGSETEA